MLEESCGYRSSAVCKSVFLLRFTYRFLTSPYSKEVCSRALNSFQGSDRPQLKFDGIVATRTNSRRNRREHAAIEVSKAAINVGSKKWETDVSKIMRGIHAMLHNLRDLVDHDPDTVHKLQVPGLVHAGRFSSPVLG
jgi:hypothetical protein